MKRLAVVIFALIAVQNVGYSQKLKDKFKNKISGISGSQDSVAFDDRSMTEIAKGWETGEYKMWDKYTGMNAWDPEVGKTYLHFDRNDAGDVVSIRHGEEIIYATFEPYAYGGSDFIGCYFESAMNIIHLTDESVICYSLDKDYRVSELNWCAGKKVKYKSAMKMVQALRDYRENTVEGDREAIAQEEKEHREKYSLENKNVVAIKAVFPDGKPIAIKDGSSYVIGFEITLEDGTVWKTSNIGGEAYVEDLEISTEKNCWVSGVGNDYSTGMYGGNPKTRASITGSVSDLTRDIATIVVKPKYSGSAELKLEFNVAYKQKELYMCTGQDGYPGYNNSSQGGRAGHGCPVEVEITTTKHSETGAFLFIARITDDFTGKTEILKFTSALHVNVEGGMGGTGAPGNDSQDDDLAVPTDGGMGGTGGNGGDIELILDPSATDLQFTYNVDAGSGGDGGDGGHCWSCPAGRNGARGPKGTAGTSGSFNKTVRSVSIK